MARKQQELKSVISVYGKADGSLDTLAKKIKSFGDNVSKIGGAMTMMTAPIIASIKTSTSLYTGYDDILRKIQAAGNYSPKQMQTIGDAARQAGADTRYMASDAASAFLSLTQAGVQLENSLDTLPTLLNAAAAGDMDLAAASDLLISNVYSLGKAFEKNDVAAYMDKVVTAADASNTNVQEMMEGVSKIGAAGRLFAGGDSELLAFLGMLANLNMKGTTGGINARNMIISLLAPTKKAATLINSLEISEEELDETLEGIDLKSASAAMEKMGLETVDATGKVRPMVDILTDLKNATDGMADDEKANVLYSVFGKRTYPAVMGLMELLGQYPDLLEKIGASAGATQRKAETLESGIGGSVRTLKSAFEELQISISEASSDKVMEWMSKARNFLLDASDWLNGLDPETVNTFLDTVVSVAGMGAGLFVAGKGIRVFSDVLKAVSTPGGAIALGAAALVTLGIAIASAQDAAAREDLEKHFGTLEIDSAKVSAWIGSMSSAYETAAESIGSYGEAVKAAGENYEGYVRQFSGGILEAFLTQTTLNEQDKEALGSYVSAMVDEVKNAAGQQEVHLGEIIKITYDGANQGDTEKANAWNEAIDGLFGALETDAQEAGQNLMQVYLDAARDGVIYADEKELIAEAQAKLNNVMAQIQSLNADIDWNTMLSQAMDLSYDSLQEGLTMIAEAKQKSDQETQENFYQLMGTEKAYEDRKLAIPQAVLDAYGIEQGDYAGWKAGIESDANEQKLDNNQRRDRGSAQVGDYAFNTYVKNESRVDLASIESIAQGIIDGTVTLDEAFERADDIIGDMNQGDAKKAANGLETIMQTISTALPFDELVAQIQRQKETQGVVSDELMELYKDYLMVGLFNGQVMGGWFSKESQFGLSTEAGIPDSSAVYMGGREIGKKSDLAIGTTSPEELNQKAAEAVGTAKETIEGTVANMTIGETPSGGEIAIGVTGDAQAYLDANPVTVRVSYDEVLGAPEKRNTETSGTKLKKHALGGYSDQPAIFGEAGGEWAIPERKTERTRALLRQAAAGSGFTPNEVYPEKRVEKTAMNFTFAPTIYAGDAGGVKAALEGEHSEMMSLIEEWWNEKMRERERVSFA